MKKISTILQKSNNKIIQSFAQQMKYVKHDYQILGLELTQKLNDIEHKSLYMKLAKTVSEPILRSALSFALDYNLKSGSRAKIFMWKLKELRSISKLNEKRKEKILLVNNLTKHLSELIKTLELSKYQVDIIEFEKLSSVDLDDYNLIILSGGSMLSSENKEYTFEKKLMSSNRKIIGICLGFELINLAFGGTNKKLPKAHKSVETVLLAGSNRSLENCYFSHKFAIDILGTDLEVLNSEDNIYIIKHKELPVVGFQFHPEINNKSFLIEEINKLMS